MDQNSEFINYYTILESDKSTPVEEIKRNYQRLALSFHPDKSGLDSREKFLLIQKAWMILRDDQSRKQYDALLSCYENNEILLYDTINLSDMDFNTEDETYTYECRCGGLYYLESNKQIAPSILINCNECSFSVQVNIS